MAEMSAAMREFAARAREERFELQRCAGCGEVSWPPRDICGACWSDHLEWTPVSRAGIVLAATALHAPLEEFFRTRTPWRVGTIRLEAGPVAYAHLHGAVAEGDPVRLESRIDHQGRGVLIAMPKNGARLEDDRKLLDLVSGKGRN
jgi:uncharacterized OB-fold protein